MTKPRHMPGERMSAPFIEAHDLSLGDLRMKAYQQVNLSLAQGEAHAICAEDKGGKSELLLTLAGRMHPTQGTCMVDGNDISRLRGMRAVRKFSALAFFEHVNDVERVLRVRTIASAELGLAGKGSRGQQTRDFLAQWGLLDVADATIEDLSRYDYDRLGIALAMAHDPSLLLVDDVERDLTDHETLKLCDELCDLAHDRGITVVCGVFDYDLALRFDTATCITERARAQQQAWRRKHPHEKVA